MWIRRKVQSGQKIGRTLGLPTLNFNVGQFGLHFGPGVYASRVKIGVQTYKGALYYGPKMGKGDTLEIFVLDFSGDLYSEFVSFQPGKKIRGPMAFGSLEALKKQIEKDVESVV